MFMGSFILKKGDGQLKTAWQKTYHTPDLIKTDSIPNELRLSPCLLE